MAKVYFVLALMVQSSLIYANTEVNESEEEITSREVLKNKLEVDDDVKDIPGADKDWMEMFMTGNLYPTSSASLMASIANSDKSAEDQLEDIKEIANKITLAIQSEMANLLSYALCHSDNEQEENKLRKKRETPMDSSQLVMRLLKHIKSNNEYQNIAIEKMMSAQEIADKFGIEFNPDPEMLSDLAVAANEQAKEMTSILKDAVDGRNVTKVLEPVEFIPVDACEPVPTENDTYYVYSVHHPEPQDMFVQHPYPPQDYMPEHIHSIPPPMHYGNDYHHHHYHPQEPQMPPPHHHIPPVTPRPNFYDSVLSMSPDYYPYCPMEQVTTTIVIPIEEIVEPEPELIGEEYEETVTSKMIVSRDEEPGSATVNHVMTYTLSEKAHFRKPEIESLPEQMQYTFFLM